MVSPAVDPYTPEEEMNTRYSTWMESVYVIESVNLYLMEDTSFEYTMLIIAVLSALLSIFAVGKLEEVSEEISYYDWTFRPLFRIYIHRR